MDKELIVNLAPTGMIPTKQMTPHVPVEPSEIIEDVLACAEVGITMAHLHAREKDGRPAWNPDLYAEILTGIRKHRPDLILGISTSGRDFQEFEKRSAALFLTGDAKPDTGSLTTASLNFFGQASLNAPEMVQKLAKTMLEKGILAEVEVFDNGMVNYMKYLIKKGFLKPPYYVNMLFGNIATAQATMAEVHAMVNQLPPDVTWSVAGIGDCQLQMNVTGMLFGNGVRVGLEDHIWFDLERTKLSTNKALVERIKKIADDLGRPFLKPLDFRKKLNMHTEKGKYGFKV